MDGGGTKTLTVCVDKERKVLGQFISACSNKNSVGPALAKLAIQAGIQGALAAAGCTVADGLYSSPLFISSSSTFFSLLSTFAGLIAGCTV